jgi:hypothetical protein
VRGHPGACGGRNGGDPWPKMAVHGEVPFVVEAVVT